MPRIEYTNLVIDDFSVAKKEHTRLFIHLLTHVHTDHLKGLHDGWNYGPIYSTQQTKRMLLNRYPSLTCIRTIQRNTPTILKMSQTLELTVTFLDANHCVGSVMILIQGYLGRVLYTGDIRYDRTLFSRYKQLYPLKSLNNQFVGCSKQVDVLYLDNTFLKQKFDFPSKEQALNKLKTYIQELLDLNKHSKIYIGLDSVGKEQVLIQLARYFQTYIIVDEQRYQLIKIMGLDPQLFTTNPQEGFIQVVMKKKLIKMVKETQDSIGIILSGWVNHPTYRLQGQLYCIPYSLHSNYKEIHEFVKSIKPSFIYPIVHTYPDQNKLYYSQNSSITRRQIFNNDITLTSGQGDYLTQIQQLRRLYCSQPTQDYKLLINDIQIQKKIEEELKPPKLPQLSTVDKSMLPVHLQTVQRKKYKLKNNRNQIEINRLRNQIKIKKKMKEGQLIQSIDDSIEEEAMQSSKKKSQKSVIDLDQEPEFEPQIVQIDPFNQPFNSRLKISQEKEKSKASRYDLFHQTKLIEQIKSKLKNNQFSSNSSKEEQREATKKTIEIDPILDCRPHTLNRRERIPLSQEERRQVIPLKRKVHIGEVNLDHVNQVTFLTGQKVVNFLRQNPADFQFLIKNYKKKKCNVGEQWDI